MTEESHYLLRAVNSLADARAYVGHVEQMKITEGKTHSANELWALRSTIQQAYNGAAKLVEAWR